jgi:DNA-binding NtrC family response regulator
MKAAASSAHETRRILIVDDDQTVLEILREFFKAFKHGHDYDVATASDGSEAMNALRQETFDLVLLDIGMPRMSGLDVLTHMRNDAIRVPVLMLTGNKNTHAAAEALRGGVFAYIPKPADLLHLDHLVALALMSAPRATADRPRALQQAASTPEREAPAANGSAMPATNGTAAPVANHTATPAVNGAPAPVANDNAVGQPAVTTSRRERWAAPQRSRSSADHARPTLFPRMAKKFLSR